MTRFEILPDGLDHRRPLGGSAMRDPVTQSTPVSDSVTRTHCHNVVTEHRRYYKSVWKRSSCKQRSSPSSGPERRAALVLSGKWQIGLTPHRSPSSPSSSLWGGAARNYQLLKIRFAVHYFRIQQFCSLSHVPRSKLVSSQIYQSFEIR